MKNCALDCGGEMNGGASGCGVAVLVMVGVMWIMATTLEGQGRKTTTTTFLALVALSGKDGCGDGSQGAQQRVYTMQGTECERVGGMHTLVFKDWVQLWRAVAHSGARRVVLLDDSLTAPLATLGAHVVLPVEGMRLIIRSASTRGRTLLEDAPRVAGLKETFAALPGLIASLKKEGFMKEAGWGYHPERMEPRWRAIWRSLNEAPPLSGGAAGARMMVDWGSNAGYFSVKLGRLFPEGRVISVEAEVDEYKGVRGKHSESAQREGVKNNVFCDHNTNGDEFEKLARLGLWHIQLSLSVMHWFSYTDHNSFLSRLGWLLLGARTTFLELPEARVYGTDTGQTRADVLNEWYGGMTDEVALVKKALAFACKELGCKSAVDFQVTNLGAMFHQTGTVRTLLRIDLNRPSVPFLSDGQISLVLKMKKELRPS